MPSRSGNRPIKRRCQFVKNRAGIVLDRGRGEANNAVAALLQPGLSRGAVLDNRVVFCRIFDLDR